MRRIQWTSFCIVAPGYWLMASLTIAFTICLASPGSKGFEIYSSITRASVYQQLPKSITCIPPHIPPQLQTKLSPHPKTSNSKVAAWKCCSSTSCSKPFFQSFFHLAVRISDSLQPMQQKALALHLPVRDSHCLLLQSPCPGACNPRKNTKVTLQQEERLRLLRVGVMTWNLCRIDLSCPFCVAGVARSIITPF